MVQIAPWFQWKYEANRNAASYGLLPDLRILEIQESATEDRTAYLSDEGRLGTKHVFASDRKRP